MTLNERLFLTDLIDDFDKAVLERDEAALKSILESVYVDSDDVEPYLGNLSD